MAQIVGLLDALAAIYARLDTIEDQLPHVTPGIVVLRGKSSQIDIPDKSEVYPVRFTAAGAASADPSKLKPGGLLPAIHDASIRDGRAVPGTADGIANVGIAFRLPDSADGEYIFDLPGVPTTVSGHEFFLVEKVLLVMDKVLERLDRRPVA